MKHLEIALGEYGEKEIVGPVNNPRIVKYSTDIGNNWVKDDEVAWCSEFVNWCLLQAGIIGTKSAVARSFLSWGEETKTPILGDIVVCSRPPNPAAGHVAFFINENNGKYYCLGGNQNNEVNITAYDKSRVISCRRVKSIVELQAKVEELKKKIAEITK